MYMYNKGGSTVVRPYYPCLSVTMKVTWSKMDGKSTEQK